MPIAGICFKTWFYLGLVCCWAEAARPRFDSSTDMGLVLIPADAEVDSVIFRLRATDQDADFPLVFEVTATITPVVRIDNLPCTLYNKVCQANVILTKRLMPGRLHDFAVRVRDTKGDSNSMQATISATNTTTSRDKIFPHIPSLIMVPEDTKPGKELDYLLVRANSWSGKPVYIELWQPKELFTIRQRQTPTQTRGVITLIGELDFETQSMYTLTIYATDPYTEPGKDTRNIAGLNIVVIVQDVQDVPPIFTLAPPLTRLNNSVQTGDIILRVHAEDGDKGVPREITYGLVSEGNPFIPFFNISETTGEIVLAKPLEELTQITHVGAPVVLTVVAEEIRRSREEPPAQATVVDVGFLLGEPGNSPPYFENDKYIASIPENLEPGSVIAFPEQYSTRVRDEDIGKAGVFTLKLQNNNGTFEINPTVAEKIADFIITVRDNTLIDYEMYKSLSFKIIAQEVGPATNLSASATVVISIQDMNDNSPIFDEKSYEVTLSENVTAGTRVIQVRATDKDTGIFGSIKYTGITGQGSDAFAIEPDTGLITVAMASSLDREMAAQLQLTIEARDENGEGNIGTAPLIVNLLDVNDNAPIFEKDVYEFTLNSDLTNFTTPTFIKATDADAEPPNNEIRYELIHGNYENKFYLNEITGELILRSPITNFRRKKQSGREGLSKKSRKGFLQSEHTIRETPVTRTTLSPEVTNSTENVANGTELKRQVGEIKRHRRKRADTEVLYTLTARAYDLGVPHLASETQISVIRGAAMEARIMMFVVPGEHPNLTRTAETLAAITGGRVTVLDTRPYVPDVQPGVTGTLPAEGKRTIVTARVEQTEPGAHLVDVEKIRNALAANGVGIIGGTANMSMTYNETTTKLPIDGIIHDGGESAGTYVNKTISNVHEEVTVYKAENKLLFWLLIILGLLMLLAIAALIICCICPGCPFYMAPRKRRVYSSETLIARSDGRPKRHLHRKPMAAIEVTSNGKKQAWSADPTRRNWQFNRRNTKNGGLASLPGDVVYISEHPPIDQANVESLRLRDGPAYDPSRRRRIEEQERMYMEDVEERKVRDYDAMDTDSLQRHETERDSDILRQTYRQRYIDPDSNNEAAVREQHFYREGNAEVLQLVTRGQVEDNGSDQHRHYPTTVIVDGKDVLLQRFMQDQRARHELAMQEPEVVRTVESHQRPKNLYQHQQEVILLPEDLEFRHRRKELEELESSAQKLPMDEAPDMDAESQMRDIHRQEVLGILSTDRPPMPKEQVQATTVQSYAFHDLELARQNVLLTRLLLERESRHAGGVMMDATSYLETQSLPGQVAIATQTDRAAATQTERQIRSRSDNDESDEDSRNRKKIKTKKRQDEGESKRTRTLWMKSPIEEEQNPCFDKRLNILRKKVKEAKEGRKMSLEPEVLREISDSLDENGSSCREKEQESKTCQKQDEESSIGYKVLSEKKNDSSSSTEVSKQQYERTSDERRTETLSSPEITVDGKYVREMTEKKSTKKESRIKKEKKVESVIKPSFRVLEREITMLTKKLSKLADKKIQQTKEEEGSSQEKTKPSKDSRKESDRGTAKKKEDSKEQRRMEASPRMSKETALSKSRQKFKYQQPQIMSPGSSEYDDAFEKSKKSKLGYRQEVTKHKQTKMKKQTQVDRKEHKKQAAQQDREIEKRKDTASKESSRLDSKPERAAKLLSRTQKLAAVGRRENISEEPSTSTSSDRVRKDVFATRDSDKKSTESSEIPSNFADQPESRRQVDRANERFSDDFVTELQEEKDQQNAFRPVMDTSRYKRDITDGTKDTEIIQQFSDDFTIETQIKEMEYPTPAAIESSSEVERTAHDLEKEHVTLKEAAQDIVVLQNLERTQPESETTLDTARKQQIELLEVSHVKQRDEIIALDSDVLKEIEEHRIERPSPHTIKSEEKIIPTFEEVEKEIDESREIEKIEEDTSEQDLHKMKALEIIEEDGKEEVLDALEKHAESLEISSDAIDHAEQKEHYKENGLYSDALTLSKMEDSKDTKDVTDTIYSNGEDKTAVSPKAGSDMEEKLSSHESEKRSEREIPLAESVIDIERKIAEELMKKEDEDDLCKIQSDVEETVITATEATNGHEDVTQKLKDTSETYQESILETVKKSLKSKIQRSDAFEEVSDTSESPKSDKISITHDKISTSVDESSQKLPKDILTQSEPSKATEITKEDIDTDKLAHDDDRPMEVEIESHETKEESHISPQEPDPRETKLHETDEHKLFTPLREISTSKEEVADTEKSQIEHITVKEETFHKELEEGKEEICKVKEASEGKTEETLDKESTSDQLSKDSDLEKSAVSELDIMERSDTGIESVDIERVAHQQDQGEQQTDVSVPIFTSFIDTLDVSEESDSSTDISRKTTLTAKPYDTPRHRQIWQKQETLEIAGMPEMRTSKDGRGTTMETEPEEDTDGNLSLDEIEDVEDTVSIEVADSEQKEEPIDTAVKIEKIIPGDVKVLSDSEKIDDEDKQDETDKPRRQPEEIIEPETDIKTDVKDLLTTIQGEILSTLSAKELHGISKENVEDKSFQAAKEEYFSKVYEKKQDDRGEIRSPLKQMEQEDLREDAVRTNVEVGKIKTEDTQIDKIKSKSDAPLSSKKHAAKVESLESPVKKKKKFERRKVSSPGEKKRIVEGEAEEKTTSTRSSRRSRKDIETDSEKQTKDGGSRRRSRKEEEQQRKQALPETKLKTDKKSTVSPKTGEVDTSRTQSKYMAWYNKKREEAAKKRSEKKTAEDEEQLPRWVSRSLKHRTAKQRDRRSSTEHKTPEMTPRTRRKVKPLVNVESEQLKAIVRQGRRLRRAEGNLKEDPPIQIFARTPPVSLDTQHRLLQHSEYKYEKTLAPFYLHPPPPAPHPSPQLSPERSFEMQPSTSQCRQSEDEPHPDNVAPFPSGSRLRHQQLLEKKSVFDIAYSEAAPSQLRSDSATPPS